MARGDGCDRDVLDLDYLGRDASTAKTMLKTDASNAGGDEFWREDNYGMHGEQNGDFTVMEGYTEA